MIQEELKARRKALATQADTLRTRRQTLLEHEDCESAEALDAALKQAEAEKAEAGKVVRAARKRADDATKALERAEAVAAKFATLRKAETALAELTARAEEVDRQRKRLDAARRAGGLADLAAALAERRSEAKRAAAATNASAGQLGAAKRTQAETAERLGKEKERDSERLRAKEAVAEFRRLRPVLERLKTATAERDQLQTGHAKAREQLDQAQARHTSLDKSVKALEDAVRDGAASLGDRRVLERQLEDARKALAGRDALAAAEQEEGLLAAQLSAAKEGARQAEAGLETARAHLRQLLDAREAARAVVLAAELEPGKPCPVCGSEDHPRPATGDEAVPDGSAIALAEAAVAGAQTAARSAREALHALETRQAAAETRVASGRSQLGDLAAAPPDALRTDVRAAEAQLSRHDAATEDLAAKREMLERQQGERAALATAIDEDRNTVETLRADLSAARATLEHTRGQVPEALREVADIAQAEAAAATELEALEAALEAATRAEEEARLALAGLESEHKSAQAHEAGVQEVLRKAEAEWAQRLSGAGFATDAEFADARVPEAERDTLQAGIERYDQSRVAAETSLRSATADVAGLQPPDMDQLKEAASEASGVHARAAEAHGAIGNRIAALSRTKEALESLEKDLEAAEARYGIVGTIADAANGQNPHRISLQRFVLASRLDDVLAAASKRLSRMSRGRYLLRRNTTAADRRSAGGLELEVEDAYTAQSRPVATLSGGESFQAALSLALGLSEVVQAYSGGIRLDTIFVDEGFGSLDPEALDLAINTLIDLQASGRLVGVISHVPELKERIDVRLEIQTGTTGSRAAFRLP
jgi:exonuclease SbcC